MKNACELEIMVVRHREGGKVWSHDENLKIMKNYCDPATIGYHHLYPGEEHGAMFPLPSREYRTCLKNIEEHVTNFVEASMK